MVQLEERYATMRAMAKDTLAVGVHWDLSDLYSSYKDKKIAKDKDAIQREIATFTKQYKSNIHTVKSAQDLLSAIESYEQILEKTTLISAYASYLHSIETNDQDIGKLYQESKELESTVSASLAWFEIELLQIPENVFAKMQREPKLINYAQYLKDVRKFKKFTLSEKEEVILSKKAQTSTSALIRLFDEVDSRNTYELRVNEKKHRLNYSALTPYLTVYPDRDVREKAALALTKGLKDKGKLYSFTLNMLLQDKNITDEIRGYSFPQEESFLRYGVGKDTVGTMVSTIEKGYTIPEKFYQAKAKLLGHSLYEWDRYSSVSTQKPQTYSWEEAKAIVLSSFREFSPVFSDIAEKFFKNNWIHAEITSHKRAGAYCSYNIPSLHPYVLVNFAGQIRDVTTLAHELGHGVHGYLSRQNRLLEAWPSTVIAEIASIFGELLVFDNIYKTVTDKDLRISLMTEQIQSIFASVFRQNAFYLFESDIHMHRRTKGELAIDDFNAHFQKRLQAMFGSGLTLTAGHAYWWMTILHFYRYNFYVFSYSFGQMLALALYARYKKEGKKTVSDYIEALSLGSSKDPYEITKTMGVDIKDPKFWNNGLSFIDNYVDEFITLTK